MIRKILFAFYQVAFFLWEFRSRGGRINFGLVECGWPQTVWQQKFIVFGYLTVSSSEIYLQLENNWYELSQSPQFELFKFLNQGASIEKSSYYQKAKKELKDEDFEFWLKSKRQLWSQFDSETWHFEPIVVRTGRGVYSVQDGAHRLAISYLQGRRSFRVKVSLWSLG